ncbi:hypothetical protein AVEN_222855-1 [Araneus ventricosus]|uniref:Uncharacterized protein n=1 Tax=Araneus ventricosus TaxID=182803 RepID=A0A4Y2P9F0_ARAVE|nr:hypothetical protein AVEN_222855-1 [Araneus ventricosus]
MAKQNTNFLLFFYVFAIDTDAFVVPRNQFLETILVKIGDQRLTEVLHSLNAILMNMCGSEAPTVLTLMQEKGESLIRQDRGCRPSDPISANPNDECVLLHPLVCRVLHYPQL